MTTAMLDRSTRLAHLTNSPSMREWERHFPGFFDNLLMVGATANVILQLANPAVGYGVKESIVHSGNIFAKPFKRTRTTLTYLAVATLGTAEEKLAYRQAVNQSHRQVHSRASSPVKYNAFSTDLQLWVASCLFFGYLDLWRKLHGEASRSDMDKMLHMLEPLATTLQVSAADWHKDMAAFDAYWESRLNALEIDEVIRDYLMGLVDLKFLNRGLQWLFADFNRFVTTGFLPPQIRTQMQLDWNSAQQRRFDRMLRAISLLNRVTPLPVRGLTINLLLWDLRYRMRHGKALV